MSCTAPSLTVEADETSEDSSLLKCPTSLTEARSNSNLRRASYHTVRRPSIEFSADAIFLKVDLFVYELERRLDWLEKYGNLQIDAGVKRAHDMLAMVRDSCSHVSGELIGAGRRRAKILVETIEGHYKDGALTRATLEQKAQASMRLMEGYLSELEAKTHAVGRKHASSISEVVDQGWRRMDEGIGRARVVVDESLERARKAKVTLGESIQHAIDRAKEQRLIRYEDLPHPWRTNGYIVGGYRFTESKIECVASMFKYSNETVNIWSHAFGLIIVLAIAFHFYPTSPNFTVSSNADVFIAGVFFFAACKCLACSTVWHTMNSIAHQSLMERFACVDYTGISLLIAASIMTTEWCAFYCEPVSRCIYMGMTATLGVGGVILPWHPTFNRHDMAWARVAFYVSLATTGFAPILQLSLTKGLTWSFYFYAPITKSILVYFGGAIIYASKIPERWLPGWFDYAGGSHNIWHLAVLGGILFHYVAMQDFFSYAFYMAQGECSVY
ncbi:MAG: hypothetical protein M1834_007900 [Cirrosporium novae-zelandiae]|nr:MAG: hypothetical protein M1834_007900 [Cirrosporium novae-zelandiae]